MRLYEGFGNCWVLDKKYWMCISCLKTWAVKQDSKAEQTENNIPQGTSS